MGPRDLSDPLERALRAIEREIAGKAFEIGYVLDAAGRVLVRRTGGRAIVDFSDIPDMIRGRYVIHNHPGGNSFCEEDVQFLFAFRPREIRVVTEHHVYVFPQPEGDVAWEDVADLVRWLKHNLYASALRAIDVEGADPVRIQAGMFHGLWAELSEIREWAYRQEERR